MTDKTDDIQEKEDLQENVENQQEETVETPELTEVEKLQAENKELKDKHMRLYAEFENFRRRTQKEKLELMVSGGVDIVKSLLPVLDDYERGNKAQSEATDVEEIKQGQELIQQKLLNILDGKGLKPMESSIGKPFDTDFHEAITQFPAPEEAMKGKVMDEVETGYMFNDKVLRYAKVVVAK
ncbi:MAG: nucleotide exchange factor GrpE [Flavobacteriales bacterium]